MTKEEIMKELDKMLEDETSQLIYQVYHNGRVIAMFLRRWEAEKFIEYSGRNHNGYKLIVNN